MELNSSTFHSLKNHKIRFWLVKCCENGIYSVLKNRNCVSYGDYVAGAGLLTKSEQLC